LHISEHPISKTKILLNDRVVGGFSILDGGEADDRIIVVLENAPLRTSVDDIAGLPPALIRRIRHYLMTYKLIAREEKKVPIGRAYGADHSRYRKIASVLHSTSRYYYFHRGELLNGSFSLLHTLTFVRKM